MRTLSATHPASPMGPGRCRHYREAVSFNLFYRNAPELDCRRLQRTEGASALEDGTHPERGS